MTNPTNNDGAPGRHEYIPTQLGDNSPCAWANHPDAIGSEYACRLLPSDPVHLTAAEVYEKAPTLISKHGAVYARVAPVGGDTLRDEIVSAAIEAVHESIMPSQVEDWAWVIPKYLARLKSAVLALDGDTIRTTPPTTEASNLISRSDALAIADEWPKNWTGKCSGHDDNPCCHVRTAQAIADRFAALPAVGVWPPSLIFEVVDTDAGTDFDPVTFYRREVAQKYADMINGNSGTRSFEVRERLVYDAQPVAVDQVNDAVNGGAQVQGSRAVGGGPVAKCQRCGGSGETEGYGGNNIPCGHCSGTGEDFMSQVAAPAPAVRAAAEDVDDN